MSFYYDDYFDEWYIDLHDDEEQQPKRERHCDGCQAYEQLGITACEGCAG